jgi:hypothetical protein
VGGVVIPAARKKEQRPGGGHPGPLSEGRVNRVQPTTFSTDRLFRFRFDPLGIIVIVPRENAQNPPEFRAIFIKSCHKSSCARYFSFPDEELPEVAEIGRRLSNWHRRDDGKAGEALLGPDIKLYENVVYM